MDATRHLLVIADDFGIGLETSRGVLELAARGLVTGTALLTNSPHAAQSVALWARAGEPAELGWHPCLTLDRPLSPPGEVASLVGFDGKFLQLGTFLRRLLARHVQPDHVRTELTAQYRRFVELTGRPPRFVNSHQHVSLFPPVRKALSGLLRDAPRPVYVRRVREPWSLLRAVGGARRKRAALNLLGRHAAKRQEQDGFPGAGCFAGLSDPRDAGRADYFTRWLAHAPGDAVELMCHPGHVDAALGGRDGTPPGGSQPWRAEEYRRLCDPGFADACARYGFRRVRPSEWLDIRQRGLSHAA